MRETLGVAGSLAAAFRVLGVGAESLGSAMGVGAGTLGSATSAAAVGTAGKATCLGTTSCGATVAERRDQRSRDHHQARAQECGQQRRLANHAQAAPRCLRQGCSPLCPVDDWKVQLG